MHVHRQILTDTYTKVSRKIHAGSFLDHYVKQEQGRRNKIEVEGIRKTLRFSFLGECKSLGRKRETRYGSGRGTFLPFLSLSVSLPLTLSLSLCLSFSLTFSPSPHSFLLFFLFFVNSVERSARGFLPLIHLQTRSIILYASRISNGSIKMFVPLVTCYVSFTLFLLSSLFLL
jgi:hypothetical protein